MAGSAAARKPGEAATIAAVSAGGVIGAMSRHLLTEVFPHAPGTFAWVTFWINVAGCFLIGVLMIVVTETGRAHPLARPFLGVGVLGGFTTFSAYTVDALAALRAGSVPGALAYLGGTLVAALVAVSLAVVLTRRLFGIGRSRP
ncbi:CrcB family protein [Spongiactinospora sp. TRM90649]|uniref:fluoride efflux transporter FluC n=1 Tax=Spongiactinospora sp. TRM90649 TaxID=3031114 RepID=UPI0023FA1B28|nr:CrcB family protein [Spongiactinospora sp. TRM90649]MDF5757571.1 CrcB family protein [Spongiactinospora sp. TRM90649]